MYAHSHIHVNSLPRILIHFFFSTRTQQRLIITGKDPSNEIIYILIRCRLSPSSAEKCRLAKCW